MRRWLAPALLALTASVLPGLPGTSARAAGDLPEATIGWPTGAVIVGDAASVTVTGTGITEPTHVYLRDGTDHAGDGTLIASGDLTPDDLTVDLPLPTDHIGSHVYYVRVETSPEWDGFVTGDFATVTVVGRPSTITARLPTRTYRSGARATVTGAVTGPRRRAVQLQARGRNGTWVPLTRGRARPDGTFTLAVPTWWAATQTLRVFAPPTDTFAAAASSDTGTVHVARSYRPRGGTRFRYLLDAKYRWDPCQVIDYRINPRRMPRDGVAQIRSGFRAVSEATGLRFRYAGATSFVPFRKGQDPFVRPGNADFAIAWAPPSVVPVFAGGTVGYGGALASGGELYGGQVAFNSSANMGRTRAERRHNWKIVVLHELGHAVGLGHVTDPRQIMDPGSYRIAPQYAAGDLRGLAAVGAANGCVKNATRGQRVVGRAVLPLRGFEAQRWRASHLNHR